MTKSLPENCPRKGERWHDMKVIGRTCRVMADPIEGYVIFRFKGGMPGLLHVNDWYKRFDIRQEK